MPLDAVCVSALASELDLALRGGRIDKVQQPERDMLILSLRSAGKNLRLLIAAGTGSARMHLTSSAYENPQEPPMFCMLLRKHLTGARIAAIEQPGCDRLLLLRLNCFDELGVESEKTLVAELMGRNSNIVLVGEDGRIIDCMRRMDFAGDALRRLLPGMIYRLPPQQDKRSFFEAGDADFSEALSADRSVPPEKWLLDGFSGLSPLICRELAHRAGGSYEDIPAQLSALRETVDAGELAPYELIMDGRPADFSFMAVSQYGEAAECRLMPSFSELLDGFYTARDRESQRQRRAKELRRQMKTARDRLQRKLRGQYEELRRTETREELRERAELVKANIYRIKKGDGQVVCENYFAPDCAETVIELDRLKTPQQNITAMFKEYNKLKAAREHLTALTRQGESELDYLERVLAAIDSAESDRDLADIRRELTATGYIRQRKNAKPERAKPQSPRRFVSESGYEIFVGRSNIQNDELTLKTARRTDWFFHAQKIHGSHVIVSCRDSEPDEGTIMRAAALAAHYSQGRDAGKIPVDYTMVKNVRKPSGSLPGMVVYTDYRTVLVDGAE